MDHLKITIFLVLTVFPLISSPMDCQDGNGKIVYWCSKWSNDIKQEAHWPQRSPEKTVQINKHIIMIISQRWLRKEKKTIINIGSLFEETWIPFTHGCFLPRLFEIGSVVLEKKIFLFRQCIFAILKLSPLGKWWGPFIWRNLNPFHPGMLCAKFGWNWLSGSGD